jgi:tRNA1(Val) A37 N6-methylase TrmN6
MKSESSTLKRNRRNGESQNDKGVMVDECWKCRGTGRKFHKGEKDFVGDNCGVCKGSGKRQKSDKSQMLSQQPGKVITLRGLPDHTGNPGGFLGPAAVGIADSAELSNGEILASLGCGDWRILQLANGHKLTVDDFVCAWVAAEEMRSRGFGPSSGSFGKSVHSERTFKHLDCGCGCGSVLMTMAWAFPGSIKSSGVEAQEISFDLCKRGLEFNLGRDHPVSLFHEDFRTWKPGSDENQFELITGTPPYFPLDRFVASENHSQKVRCRVPTRGAASDYVETAARLLADNGIFVMVETARKEAEMAVLEASQKHKLSILKRLDVVTRTGLPPRFSCWVMCRSSDDRTSEYPINTFTLRDATQRRTSEYVEAMETMGWIDFENTGQRLGERSSAKLE